MALTLSGGHADAVYDVAWSHSGSHICTSSSDRTVTVWDPKAGKILRMLKGLHKHDEQVFNASLLLLEAIFLRFKPTNLLVGKIEFGGERMLFSYIIRGRAPTKIAVNVWNVYYIT